MTGSREWHLVRRPTGWPTDDDVALVEVDVPDPGPGELLVRNTVMSVEPYMRGRMDDVVSYVEPYALGAPMLGHAVGEVVASGEPGVPVGRYVVHQAGWREYALVRAADVEPVDADGFPDSTYNATESVPGPRNLLLMIWRRLRMEGFLVRDHADQRAAFTGDMSRWLREGTVRNVETVVHSGVEAAWPTFLAMLRGDNVGKMIVHLGSLSSQ